MIRRLEVSIPVAVCLSNELRQHILYLSPVRGWLADCRLTGTFADQDGRHVQPRKGNQKGVSDNEETEVEQLLPLPFPLILMSVLPGDRCEARSGDLSTHDASQKGEAALQALAD